MAKYVFAYTGGGMAETEEEQAKVMAAWGAWMGELGEALVDPGAPTGAATTVNPDGSTTTGGSLSGYSLYEADSLDAAVKAAKGCPILASGGSVQVHETIEM